MEDFCCNVINISVSKLASSLCLVQCVTPRHLELKLLSHWFKFLSSLQQLRFGIEEIIVLAGPDVTVLRLCLGFCQHPSVQTLRPKIPRFQSFFCYLKWLESNFGRGKMYTKFFSFSAVSLPCRCLRERKCVLVIFFFQVATRSLSKCVKEATLLESLVLTKLNTHLPRNPQGPPFKFRRCFTPQFCTHRLIFDEFKD